MIKMKKILIFLLSLLFVFAMISAKNAYAEENEDYGAEITDELNELLEDYNIGFGTDDIGELSFGDLWDKLWSELAARIAAPMRILASIFIVIVFSAVTKSAEKKSGDIYSMVCVMAAVTVTVPQLMTVYGEILHSIQLTGSFILVFVPIMSTVSAFCGGITTAGVCHMLLLGVSEVIVKLSESYLLPVLGVTAAMSVTGSIFPSSSLESLVELLKKAVTWGISITMTLFSGFVTLKCTITGKADGAAAKTAKMLVSNCIPIVGGAVSDAYSTVKGSFEVIGGTVGVAGIIGILMLLLPEILELFIYRGIMWIGKAAADVFSAEPISKLLKSLDSGFAIAQCVMISYSVIFILCTAILLSTFGG